MPVESQDEALVVYGKGKLKVASVPAWELSVVLCSCFRWGRISYGSCSLWTKYFSWPSVFLLILVHKG
ncbi:MAG: hypothetical protein DRI37_10370 [Chloroflexi bacterium]|nr:MAG: hypothetical protein DRI37_10370 [Chloroflexota bacterium]